MSDCFRMGPTGALVAGCAIRFWAEESRSFSPCVQVISSCADAARRMDSRLRGNDVGRSRNDVDRHGNDVGRSRIDSRLRRPLNN